MHQRFAMVVFSVLAALLAVACGDGDGGVWIPPPVGPSEPASAPCYGSIAAEGAAQGSYRMWSYPANVSIADVAISDRGWRAVAGGQDNNIYYFDRSMAAPRNTYTTGGQVNSVAISHEGASFVAGSWDGKLYFFECDATQPTWVYDTGQDQPLGGSIVEDVAIDNWGRYIAAVSQTHVYLFKRTSGQPILKLDLGSTALATVEISGLGTYLFVGTRPESGSQARVFLLDRTKLIWSYGIPDFGWGPNDLPTPVAVNFDGSVLAAGGRDNQIHVWTQRVQTPLWTYTIAPDSPVSSVDLSWDGSRLVATGNFSLYFYDSADTASSTPSYTNDGTRSDPSPFFAQPDVYATGTPSTTGLYGIGNFLRASAISANGTYILAAEPGNHLAFGLSRYDNRVLRSYDLADTVGAVDISPDGSWVMLAGSFSGIIRRFEVAPLEIVDVAVPLTYRILDDNVDVLSQLIGGTDFTVDYSILKPGRAAVLDEEWSIWAYQAGLLLPPSSPFCLGTKTWSWTQDLADDNVEVHGTRQITPPTCMESSISTIDLFVLQAEINDQPSISDLSDDSATLATVQIASP